jgi:ribosomal protein S7
MSSSRSRVVVENDEPFPLPELIRIRGKGLRPTVRTVAEGIRLIDSELPIELRSLPRWSFARELLVHAATSRKKRDLIAAARQLRQALSNEGWLAPDKMEAAKEKVARR